MGLVIFQSAFCKIMRLFINTELASGSGGWAVSMATPGREGAQLVSSGPRPTRCKGPSSPVPRWRGGQEGLKRQHLTGSDVAFTLVRSTAPLKPRAALCLPQEELNTLLE